MERVRREIAKKGHDPSQLAPFSLSVPIVKIGVWETRGRFTFRADSLHFAQSLASLTDESAGKGWARTKQK